jgi:hypothetical protein
MAWSKNKQTNVNASNGTASAVSFTALPSAGDLVLVFISYYESGASPTISSITDNQGNTYNPVGVTAAFAGAHTKLAIYYAENIGAPSGTYTITVNFGALSHDTVVYAVSFSGIATSSSLRGTPQTATGNDTPVDANVTSDPNPQAGDLLIAAACAAVAGSTNVHFAGATGFTNMAVYQDYTDYNSLSADYKTAVGGAETATYSHDSTATPGDGWGAVIAAFKPASGGGSPLRRNSILNGLGASGPFFNNPLG